MLLVWEPKKCFFFYFLCGGLIKLSFRLGFFHHRNFLFLKGMSYLYEFQENKERIMRLRTNKSKGKRVRRVTIEIEVFFKYLSKCQRQPNFFYVLTSFCSFLRQAWDQFWFWPHRKPNNKRTNKHMKRLMNIISVPWKTTKK